MTKKAKRTEKEYYKEYVKAVTPVHTFVDEYVPKAFVTGGVICMIGQGILNYCESSWA